MTITLQSVVQKLRENGWTLSFAESCTGGLLSSQLTASPGVSDVFMGAVVSYSNEAKKEILGVKETTLQAAGAVSEPVASEMAEGARHCFRTHWSLAITGIAGPSGGSKEKPVGMVCFAVAGLVDGKKKSAMKTEFLSGDRQEIQKQSAKAAIQFLYEEINRV